MLLTSWIERIGQPWNRDSRSRRKDRRFATASERLEERSLLTVSATFIAGELELNLDSGDSVSVRENPVSLGNVQVLANGLPLESIGTVPAASVSTLLINGGDEANVIDLTGMQGAVFSNPALVINVRAANGDDTLLGSPNLASSLDGGHGDDSITGGNAADTLLGDDGQDSIFAGGGNDSVDSGDGQDTVDGSTGDDTILGGDGEDSIDGNAGNDNITSDDGSDTVNGGDGNDTLNGMAGADVLNGNDGDDSIFGGAGDDTLTGNVGNDFLDGQAGLDSLRGSDGNDSLIGGDGNDILSGEAGNDTLNGSAHNDTLVGSDGDDSLLGGAGADSMDGRLGNDTIRGQSGNDSLVGGGGIDFLDGGIGNDVLMSVGSEVSISDAATVTEGNSGTTLATFTVSLSQTSFETLVVDFSTQDGTAVAGSDYQATQGTLTFLPGEFQKTISVPVIGDTIGEADETFSVQLTGNQNVVIADNVGAVAIADDDVQIQINDVTQNEGNAGQTPFVFTVTLSQASAGTISVQFVTANNDAVGGLDYVAATGTVTFNPGTTTQTITVNVFGEQVGENTEQFFVNLSNPSGAAITDGQGIGTITDDDGGPLTFPVVTELGRLDRGDDSDIVPPGASGFTFTDNNRWDTTATQGGGLAQGAATILTWGIVPDGTPLDDGTPSNLIARLDTIYNETATGPNVTNRTWYTLFVSVFDRYASFSGLSYIYEPNDDRSAFPDTGVVGVRPDVRIGGRNIDGNFGVLAFNYFPNFSDMVIDTNDSVYTNTSSNSLILRNILAHEHGHGLGFPHVMPTNQTKLMEPFLSTNFDGPQEDDILATNRGYGDRNEKGTGNDTALIATSLGIVTPTTPAAMDQVSIDDDSDTDFYSFVVSQNVTASILVTPTGTTYLSGTQGGPPPQTFNALTQSDLAFQILAPDMTTVLATVNGSGLGQTEALNNFLLGSGTYFVRVTGAQNMVQMYNLGLSVVASAVGPAPTVSDLGDTLLGGDGEDVIIAGSGDDFISGDGGKDTVSAGDGNDSVLGGTGADRLDGQAGDDTLRGQGGTDTLIGGEGDDVYDWDANVDGVDQVSSVSGSDQMRVFTGIGADAVTIGKIGTKLQVTSGLNVLTISPTIRIVSIDTGDGTDTITVGDLNGVLPTVLTINGGLGNDTINAGAAVLGFVRMQLNGNDGNDSITGSVSDDTIEGGAGLDTLNGGTGNDTIRGGTDIDNINGGAGDDSIEGNDGNDFLIGGAGHDVMRGNLGNDLVSGNSGHDTLEGNDGRDTLHGGIDNDSLDGGIGKDTLTGADGNDTLDGGRNDDILTGDAGDDSIRGNHGNDIIDSGIGADIINGGDGNDSLTGGDGNDLIAGHNGNDSINAGEGNDLVTGGDGADIILGGGGNDGLFGNDGDDTLNGQAGANTLAGGQGVDALVGAVLEIDESFTLDNTLLVKLGLL